VGSKRLKTPALETVKCLFYVSFLNNTPECVTK